MHPYYQDQDNRFHQQEDALRSMKFEFFTAHDLGIEDRIESIFREYVRDLSNSSEPVDVRVKMLWDIFLTALKYTVVARNEPVIFKIFIEEAIRHCKEMWTPDYLIFACELADRLKLYCVDEEDRLAVENLRSQTESLYEKRSEMNRASNPVRYL